MRPPHNDWIQGNSAGAYTSTVDKFLIHTTEGSSIDGAVGAYRANNSWPHLTVDCMYGHSYRICGHLDLDVAARSLRNESGGVQTNTDGVVQVEVCGFAENPGGIDWAWLGANVVGPCCEMKNIQVVSTLPWVAYPASYGTGAVQRLSASQWTNYRGILGHQHAPENSHGDPGAIPIKTLLDAASSDGGFLMALSDKEQEDMRVRLIRIEKALANGGFLGSGESLNATLGLLAQVDRAFVEDRGSDDVRTAFADQLIDIGLERSDTFGALVAKVDEILDRLPEVPAR